MLLTRLCVRFARTKRVSLARRAQGAFEGALTNQLRVATVLERYPLSMPPKTEMEETWFDFQAKMRVEKAALSFDEYESLRAASSKKGKGKGKGKDKKAADAPVDTDGSQGSEEISFTAADYETEADRKGDTRSLLRHVCGKLYLVVKDMPDSPWKFPTITRDIDPATPLRLTAEEALYAVIPKEEVEHHFVGNAPSLVKKNSDDNILTFYYRCIYKRGRNAPLDSYSDYAWISKDEMTSYLPKEEAKEINRILVM